MDDPVDEEALVRRARAGDAAARQELLVRNLPIVRAYVRSHLPHELRLHESCSDIVSSVCREVLSKEATPAADGVEAFRGWLCVWARHKIQDRLRYWRADKRASAREANRSLEESLGEVAAVHRLQDQPLLAAMRTEDLLRFEQAMERLPEEYREVIGLCRIAGLSRETAGQLMGDRSPGAVRSLLNRALVALSSALERTRPDR